MTSIKKDSRGWLLLLSVIVIVADRITKWLASTRIELGSHVVVIAHVFAISHVENPGAAFSLFNDSGSPARVRWMLLVFSVLAAIAVLVALLKLGRTSRPLRLHWRSSLGALWGMLMTGCGSDRLSTFLKCTSFTTTGRISMLPIRLL